jgi:hypothetical protein
MKLPITSLLVMVCSHAFAAPTMFFSWNAQPSNHYSTLSMELTTLRSAPNQPAAIVVHEESPQEHTYLVVLRDGDCGRSTGKEGKSGGVLTMLSDEDDPDPKEYAWSVWLPKRPTSSAEERRRYDVPSSQYDVIATELCSRYSQDFLAQINDKLAAIETAKKARKNRPEAVKKAEQEAADQTWRNMTNARIEQYRQQEREEAAKVVATKAAQEAYDRAHAEPVPSLGDAFGRAMGAANQQVKSMTKPALSAQDKAEFEARVTGQVAGQNSASNSESQPHKEGRSEEPLGPLLKREYDTPNPQPDWAAEEEKDAAHQADEQRRHEAAVAKAKAERVIGKPCPAVGMCAVSK